MAKKRKASGFVPSGRKPKGPLPDLKGLDVVDDSELYLWAADVRWRRAEARAASEKKTKPTPLAKHFKAVKRRTGTHLSEDIKLIREYWERSVGPVVAAETRVYSFVRGVLTIEVLSGPLLQELRQFDGHGVFSDLSDIWQASQPLVKIKYRLGKR